MIIELTKAQFDLISSRQKAIDSVQRELQAATLMANREQVAFSEILNAIVLDGGAKPTDQFGRTETSVKDGKYILELHPISQAVIQIPTEGAPQ